MDQYVPSGDPNSYTALYRVDPAPAGWSGGSIATRTHPTGTGTAAVCVLNGAGGLLSVLEFRVDVGPEQALASAGWHRTEAWRNDHAGQQWARVEARPSSLPIQPRGDRR